MHHRTGCRERHLVITFHRAWSCLSYVRRLLCMRLLTVGRDLPGWLSHERHRAECRAMLDVTRVIRFVTGLPRACCKAYFFLLTRLNNDKNKFQLDQDHMPLPYFSLIFNMLICPNCQFSQSSRSMVGALHVYYSYTISRKMLTLVEVSSICDVGKFLQEFKGCG